MKFLNCRENKDDLQFVSSLQNFPTTKTKRSGVFTDIFLKYPEIKVLKPLYHIIKG